MEIDVSKNGQQFEKPRIEEGEYQALFVKASSAGEGEYGPRVAWEFHIPPHELKTRIDKEKYSNGVSVSAITGSRITPKSRAGSIVKNLGIAEDKWPDSKFNTALIENKPCRIIVRDYDAMIDNVKTKCSTVSDVMVAIASKVTVETVQ